MAKTQSEIQAKYDKAHCTTLGLKLNKKYDSDLLNKLMSVPSKQGYIKQLIRNDIKNNSEIIPVAERGLKKSIPIQQDTFISRPINTVHLSDREVFRQNLIELMILTKVKQVDVAKYVEVSYQTVSAWVAGRGYPRADAMQKLCAFFGVKQSVLTEYHGQSESGEEKLIKMFRAISQKGKEKLMERAEELVKLNPIKEDYKENNIEMQGGYL